jgi:urease gamma subunit
MGEGGVMVQYGFSPKTISLDASDVFSLFYVSNFKERRKPKKVIINDPATVVFFKDGSKTVTKARDGDEYDPLFGIMACALRKVGKNRVRIDAWEPVIDFLASYLADAKECRVIADMLNTTADALELDGVMDAMEEYDVRSEQGDTVCLRTFDESTAEDIKDLEEVLHGRERTRQRIRDLIDRGEL